MVSVVALVAFAVSSVAAGSLEMGQNAQVSIDSLQVGVSTVLRVMRSLLTPTLPRPSRSVDLRALAEFAR
ncbi:hypothetical protein GQ600_14948 [Phytophthora cactorum]|nr:hypothetical protein GQ600_14948 [Phytophthora cactorum]